MKEEIYERIKELKDTDCYSPYQANAAINELINILEDVLKYVSFD